MNVKGVNEMCTFCKALINRKKIVWQERNTMDVDNFCETVCDDRCYGCTGCSTRLFTLRPVVIEGNVYISVEYFRSAYGTTIYPTSELMQLSFCPFCGKQISHRVAEFDRQPDCYSILEEN